MYDRTTWIVLILCGVLLALGMREQSKMGEQRRLEQEKQRQEQAAKSGDPAAASDTAAVAEKPALVVEAPPPPAEEVTVTLETPEVVFTFSNIGGGIKFAEFKNQFQVDDKSTPVRINDRGGAPIGGIAGPDAKMENVAYTYDEAASVPGQTVVYVGRLGSGLLARKVFSLVTDGRPGSPYLLNLGLTLENPATTPFGLKEWSLYAGTAVQQHKDEFAHYIGAFWFKDNDMHFRHAGKFTKGFFSSAKSNIDSDLGDPVQFAGVTDQFFSTVLRPEPPMASTVWSRPGHIPGKSVRAGLRFPDVALNPGDRREFVYQIFIGPKHNPMLRKMGAGWGELMQYGGPVYDWLLVPIMARVLHWALNSIHGLIEGFANSWSWGLSIIILTILLRIAIWPLHAKSTRTMKRMAKLQPEMQRLKEKYSDDPQRMNAELMGLYKKFGINPLGGCLPMFAQLPIFFGFFIMLQYAVELRGESFLWVADLSQPDTQWHLMGIPINILPIVMAATSFLQIKMMPATGDPMQRKIILFMPFMFFFFCYNFASALALYWTVQNIFSIGQTWLMNRMPEPELVARKVPAKKSWLQRMAEQQAAMQKQRQQEVAARSGSGGAKSAADTPNQRPPRTGG